MRVLAVLVVVALPALMAACGKTPPPASAAPTAMTVHKSPSCGCCTKWMDHVTGQGLATEVQSAPDVLAVQKRLGVPEGLYSCHVAEVGGYLIVGHVPADDIKRLLKDKPAARGIAVPGMPVGSPGMEHDGHVQAYDTVLFQADGTTSLFARHGSHAP